MGLEAGTTIGDLVATNPLSTDPRSEGDDHLRLIKAVLKADAVSVAGIHAAAGKSTPVDADELAIIDSEAANVLKKLTWANLKAVLLGVTAGKAQQIDQPATVTGRGGTTDLNNQSLEGTLSDTGIDITAFHGVAGVTYKRKCLGAGDITAGAGLSILQGGASITTAAGDTFEVYMLTSTTCEVRNYQRATAVSFSVHKNGTNQSIPNNINTKVTFSTEEFDIGGYFDTTNSRFTPPAGYYNFNASATLASSADTKATILVLCKNGAAYKWGPYNRASGTVSIGAGINCIAAANGTDYFELYVFQNNGTQNLSGAVANSYFMGHRIGDL